MFRVDQPQNPFAAGFRLAERIFHSTVRSIRRKQGNAVLGLLKNILQTVIFLAVFYLMMELLGMRGAAIRGDFVLYLMSGVFLYMTHTRAIGAVFGSEGPTSPMMLHAPMNTVIAIASAALGSLYMQVLSMVVVLYVYHVAFTPITIDDPVGAFAMFLLAWFSGVGIGMVFLALKPWFPGLAAILQSIYSRANMLFSGKMFVANAMSFTMLAIFRWNPLFHTIDQARGFVFLNYFPRYTSPWYPLAVTVPLLMIGLMGEFFTRRRASISWWAGR